MEWSPVTHSLFKSSFIDDRKPYEAECLFFGREMGLMAQWPIPDKPSSYEQFRNKETNGSMHGRHIRSGQDLNQERLD